MDWLKIARTYLAEYIERVQALLRIPTVLDAYRPEDVEAPFGKPIREALDWMLEVARNDGFITKDIMHYAGHVEMGEGEEILGILGHLDVVPAGGKWDTDPFAAVMKEGKIFARGAMDDKGPTIAAYLAMKMVHEAKIPLQRKVRLILGCDEESGMRCIQTYLKHEKMPDLAFAPDAEFPLIYAEKGSLSFDFFGDYDDDLIASLIAGERYNVVPDRAEAVLKKDVSQAFQAYLEEYQLQGHVSGDTYVVFGKNAHAAWPHLGVNAIFLMAAFLRKHTNHPLIHWIDRYLAFDHLGDKLGIAHFDSEMKELTMNTAIIRVQDGAYRLGMNVRYPRGFDVDSNLKKIEETAAKSQIGFSLVQQSNPHYISPQDPLVKKLHDAYIKYTDDRTSPIITIGGGTYARTLKRAVAFGPAFPNTLDLAHQPNEYLDLEEMVLAMAIYAESIVSLAGRE